MSGFIVISKLPASQDRAGLAEILNQWQSHQLSEKPYTVLILAETTFDEFVRRLKEFPYELTVVELGKAAHFRGIGL